MKSLSPLFWYGLYTCRLISSVINNTEPPALPENMSLDSLYAYQLSQDVISIAYAALERLDPSLNLEEYLMDNKKCILREACFDIAGQELYSCLDKAGIPFLPLKGAILKNLYPMPYHGYFTDIDIYVGDEFDKAEKVLPELGYEKLVDTDHIIDVIKQRCLNFKKFNDMFYKPYAAMRAKHSLTGVVISGFSPKHINISGLKSEDVYYGLMNRLCQPEIRCDKAVFHIYSNGSKLRKH